MFSDSDMLNNYLRNYSTYPTLTNPSPMILYFPYITNHYLITTIYNNNSYQMITIIIITTIITIPHNHMLVYFPIITNTAPYTTYIFGMSLCIRYTQLYMIITLITLILSPISYSILPPEHIVILPIN